MEYYLYIYVYVYIYIYIYIYIALFYPCQWLLMKFHQFMEIFQVMKNFEQYVK